MKRARKYSCAFPEIMSKITSIKVCFQNIVELPNIFKRIVQRNGRKADHIGLSVIGNDSLFHELVVEAFGILFYKQ